MKKIAALTIFLLMMGTVPVYAASANNTTTVNSTSTPNQIQGTEQKLTQDVKNQINAFKAQIKDLRTKIQQNRKEMIALLKQNKDLRQQIKDNKTVNSTATQIQINQTRQQIINLRNQNKEFRNQINDLRKQIKALLGK